MTSPPLLLSLKFSLIEYLKRPRPLMMVKAMRSSIAALLVFGATLLVGVLVTWTTWLP